MKSYKILFNLIFLLIMFIVCQKGKETQDKVIANEIDKIKQVEFDSETAILEGNLEKYMTLYDNDAVAMWPGASPLIGKEAIRSSYRKNIFNKLTYLEMKHFPEEVEILARCN